MTSVYHALALPPFLFWDDLQLQSKRCEIIANRRYIRCSTST